VKRRLKGTLAFLAAWLLVLALWLGFALAGGQVSLAAVFVPSVLTIGVAALLAFAVWQLCRRLPLPDGFRIGFFLTHFVAAAAYGISWVILATAAESLTSKTAWAILKTPHTITWALTGFWFYAVIAGVSYAILAQRSAREHELRALRAEAGLSGARLDALQHRLHPHFLFNALHTVAALVRQNSEQAEAAIEKLGDMLRYTLQDDIGNTVPFADEWEFTRRYLDFEQLRYGERLNVVAAIDPACLGCSAPLFALQTLVENAVHHSIAARPAGGRIEITARADDGVLSVQVRDDGANGAAPQNGAQFGLQALRERLQAVYGDRARLVVASDPAGFEVSFVIPRQSEALDDD
jgi:two-component system, LytTR family, sensor kinase